VEGGDIVTMAKNVVRLIREHKEKLTIEKKGYFSFQEAGLIG